MDNILNIRGTMVSNITTTKDVEGLQLLDLTWLHLRKTEITRNATGKL